MTSTNQERWPNFLVVGAARAGTSSLYEYLKNIPGIFLPSVKEPRFFIAKSDDEDIYNRPAIGNEKKYLKLFAASDAQFLGEATPEYLYHKDAAIKIYQQVPHSRIIITLRNPIQRALSHYLLLRRLFNLKYSFEQFLDLEYNQMNSRSGRRLFKSPGMLECGFYSEGVNAYLNLFGREQVKIIVFEEWTKDVLSTINSILEFLRLDYVPSNSLDWMQYNPSIDNESKIIMAINAIVNNNAFLARTFYTWFQVPIQPLFRNLYQHKSHKDRSRKPELISNDSRELLRSIYQHDVRNLQEILSLKLPWVDFNG